MHCVWACVRVSMRVACGVCVRRRRDTHIEKERERERERERVSETIRGEARSEARGIRVHRKVLDVGVGKYFFILLFI